VHALSSSTLLFISENFFLPRQRFHMKYENITNAAFSAVIITAATRKAVVLGAYPPPSRSTCALLSPSTTPWK
jgi:hypothetical protein